MAGAFVIVTSDTCSKDPAQDQSGDYVEDKLNQTGLFDSVRKLIESDDKDKIISSIDEVLTNYDPALIITVGGTGLTPRDVTPDATSVFYEKTCNGISTALHMTSLRYTPHAALSRLTAGIAGGTLIINFPGKLQACKECFGCLNVFLEHALEQVRYDHVAYSNTHRRQMVDANKQGRQLGKPSKDQIVSTGQALDQMSLDSGPSTKTPSVEDSYQTARLKESLAANGITLVPNAQPRPSSVLSKRSKLSIQSIEESRNEFSTLGQAQSGRGSTEHLVRPSRPGSAAPPRTIQPKMSRASSLVSLRKESHFKPPQKLPNQPKPRLQLQQAPKPCPLPSVKILQTHSSYPQIPYKASLDILASKASNLIDGPELVKIDTPAKAHNVVGCMLAEDLCTKRILPPFPVSLVDGYVVNVPPELAKVLDLIGSFSYYPIVADMNIFERMQVSDQNMFFCCQINTGARLPKFNYAIVPTEKAEKHPKDNTITFKELRQFVHVRGKGIDLGELDVIKAGTVIGPVELSCIIAMGHKTFKILPRPRIGILSTGDEIESFFTDEPLSLDSVVDTNGPMLRSMFRSLGYHVFDYHIAKDEPQDLLEKINNMLKQCKVILITGGASMGTRDHVKDVIKHIGGEIHFGRVDIKPGKPAAFASLKAGGQEKFIFSLPGNPVSAFVTSLVLTLPFLSFGPAKYLNLPGGIEDYLGEMIMAEVHQLDRGKDGYKFDGRLEFLRAKILNKKKDSSSNSCPVYQVRVSVKQQSSRLLSLVDCDCLMMVDPELKGKSLESGSRFPALKLRLIP